uniref:Calponin-homology (CH) domain-containing protein n=1 Tax=Macrostomum lignano TaxID=282301 RepID=A0A1I8G0Q9_9PLAT
MKSQLSEVTANNDAADQDKANNMTQEVFNWISRSVNKDFIRMGYPAILTKKGNKDFVSLCALMQNCSAVLTLSGSGRGLRQLQLMSAATNAKLAAELTAAKLDGDGSLLAAFEAMLETVRSDTETMIETTDCLTLLSRFAQFSSRSNSCLFTLPLVGHNSLKRRLSVF